MAKKATVAEPEGVGLSRVEQPAVKEKKTLSVTAKTIIVFAALTLAVGTSLAIHFAIAAENEGEKANSPAVDTMAVRVVELAPTSEDVVMNYVGSMQPRDLDNVTYNQISTVKAVYVEVGQKVTAGQKVALVDPENARREVNAAKSQLDVANSALNRAQLSYDYAQSELATAVGRSESGLINEESIEYYEYQVNVAQTTLDEAKAQKNSATETYNSAKATLNDCTLRASIDGYVVSVVTKVGSIATPLNPVVIVGSYESVAVFGVSPTDVHEIAVGIDCSIALAGEKYEGKILDISRIPDADARTYETRVTVPVAGETFLIGEIVSVGMHIGAREGVWIPISVILNDGRDYVFIAANGRAVKTYITLGEISDDMVRVSGLEDGGLLVVDGMRSLKSGNLVNIVD